jgi:hypothetical protein
LLAKQWQLRSRNAKFKLLDRLYVPEFNPPLIYQLLLRLALFSRHEEREFIRYLLKQLLYPNTSWASDAREGQVTNQKSGDRFVLTVIIS